MRHMFRDTQLDQVELLLQVILEKRSTSQALVEKGEFSDASLDLLERVLQSFLILPDRKSLLFQGSLEHFIGLPWKRIRREKNSKF